MRKVLTVLVVVPLGLIFIIFAVANRHVVTVSFDPFNTLDPSVGVSLPLFVVLIGSAIVGVIAGSVATWLGQGRWRRASRRHGADAAQARRMVEDLRARQAASGLTSSQRLPAVLQPVGSATISERDKPRLTL